MIKKLLKKNEGQAFIETVLIFLPLYVVVMIFLINMGFFQIVRLRLSMANRFMVYTATHARNPHRGRLLNDKVRLMLENGPPIISDKEKYFSNLNISYLEKPVSILGIKLPFGPRTVEGITSVNYILSSSIMKKIIRKRKISLSSGKMIMYKDTTYKKSGISLKELENADKGVSTVEDFNFTSSALDY